MNKNLLKICFVAAILISASSAYAVTNLSGTTIIGGGTFSPSNKVNIGVVSTATDYSGEAKHSAGDRIIGFNSKDPKMYWSTGVVGSTASGGPGTATTEHTSSGWTSL